MESEKVNERRRLCGDVWFDVDPSYSPVNIVGRGAYGVVASALYRKCKEQDSLQNEKSKKEETSSAAEKAEAELPRGKKVAIKKITSCFRTLRDAERLRREISFLRQTSHENIICLYDVMLGHSDPNVACTTENFDELYIVTDLFDCDVHSMIKCNTQYTEEHIRYFMYQLLKAVTAMHSVNVMHRDLKPSNILVNSKCAIKLCDFGLVRSVTDGSSSPDQNKSEMTMYVVTRWYRAPEILLESDYGLPTDIWSAGCIFAEMLTGKPLFSGSGNLDQITKILQVLGSPSHSDLDAITNPLARSYVESLEKTPKASFSTVVPTASADAVDLLTKMLQFDPRQRPTAEECLNHPFLLPFKSSADSKKLLPVCLEEKDVGQLNEADMRKAIVREIQLLKERQAATGSPSTSTLPSPNSTSPSSYPNSTFSTNSSAPCTTCPFAKIRREPDVLAAPSDTLHAPAPPTDSLRAPPMSGKRIGQHIKQRSLNSAAMSAAMSSSSSSSESSVPSRRCASVSPSATPAPSPPQPFSSLTVPSPPSGARNSLTSSPVPSPPLEEADAERPVQFKSSARTLRCPSDNKDSSNSSSAFSRWPSSTASSTLPSEPPRIQHRSPSFGREARASISTPLQQGASSSPRKSRNSAPAAPIISPSPPSSHTSSLPPITSELISPRKLTRPSPIKAFAHSPSGSFSSPDCSPRLKKEDCPEDTSKGLLRRAAQNTLLTKRLSSSLTVQIPSEPPSVSPRTSTSSHQNSSINSSPASCGSSLSSPISSPRKLRSPRVATLSHAGISIVGAVGDVQ
eukprot:GILI01006284.1.p1 GENE.GILI01006284.1~~GILI01006284.1.p1  ORF type:complete len:797 (+),score=182.23 GILI01006284.1:184-2574(+)